MLHTSDQGLLQRQKDIMAMQDDMLVDISRGVDRLYVQAKDIGEETKFQNKILNDLEMNVDDASDALNREAAHANEIRHKSETCWM